VFNSQRECEEEVVEGVYRCEKKKFSFQTDDEGYG
jgi:hypothetical protein